MGQNTLQKSEMFLRDYFHFISHRGHLSKRAINTSLDEVVQELKKILRLPTQLSDRSDIQEFQEKDKVRIRLFRFFRNVLGLSVWSSRVYVNSLMAFGEFSSLEDLNQVKNDPLHQEIIDRISRGEPVHSYNLCYGDLLKIVFRELNIKHNHPLYTSPLVVPKIKARIVLVDGVLNELNAYAAFERGVRHLNEIWGIKYYTARVDGLKCGQHNARMLEEQIKHILARSAHESVPEKLWLIGFSKGGVDALHFIKNNSELCEKHLIGLSTIASPIQGSSVADSKILRLLTNLLRSPQKSIGNLKDTEGSEGEEYLFQNLRKSLSEEYRTLWFKENHESFPTRPFYTSLSLYSPWYENHPYMMVLKFLLQKEGLNDGVVEAENAFFPEYFNAINFGPFPGHHLIGVRSSAFNQEALIESMVIVLHYLKLLE